MLFQRTKAHKRYGPHNIDIISIIFGTLLGDSHAERRSYNTINKGRGTRISFQQENSNMEYLIWLWKYLCERGYTTPIKPKVKTRIGKHSKIRYYYRFNTFSYHSFNYLHDYFYNNGKIRVPSYGILYEHLTPLALACWIMDDGSKHQNTLKLATNSFTKEDIGCLCKVLEDKYTIFTSIHSAGVRNQYVLYIKTESFCILRNIVKEHIVSSMEYKIKI